MAAALSTLTECTSEKSSRPVKSKSSNRVSRRIAEVVHRIITLSSRWLRDTPVYTIAEAATLVISRASITAYL